MFKRTLCATVVRFLLDLSNRTLNLLVSCRQTRRMTCYVWTSWRRWWYRTTDQINISQSNRSCVYVMLLVYC